MKRNYENFQATDIYRTLSENLSDMPFSFVYNGKDITDFTAFCYFEPEKEDGVIFAFRQENCERENLHISLPFVDSGDRYIITDEDSHDERATDGAVTLHFDAPRTARLLWVKKI